MTNATSRLVSVVVVGSVFVAACAQTPVTRMVTSEVTTTTTPPPPPPEVTTTTTTEEVQPEPRVTRRGLARAHRQPSRRDDVVTEETTEIRPTIAVSTVVTTKRSTTETTTGQ